MKRKVGADDEHDRRSKESRLVGSQCGGDEIRQRQEHRCAWYPVAAHQYFEFQASSFSRGRRRLSALLII